jgi:hypothetical protein
VDLLPVLEAHLDGGDGGGDDDAAGDGDDIRAAESAAEEMRRGYDGAAWQAPRDELTAHAIDDSQADQLLAGSALRLTRMLDRLAAAGEGDDVPPETSPESREPRSAGLTETLNRKGAMQLRASLARNEASSAHSTDRLSSFLQQARLTAERNGRGSELKM